MSRAPRVELLRAAASASGEDDLAKDRWRSRRDPSQDPRMRWPLRGKEFDTRRAGHPYQSRIPANQKPPLTYRDNPSAGGQ